MWETRDVLRENEVAWFVVIMMLQRHYSALAGFAELTTMIDWLIDNDANGANGSIPNGHTRNRNRWLYQLQSSPAVCWRVDCGLQWIDATPLTVWSFSLVFWEKEWLVGATQSTWNFESTGPRWREIADFEPIFARSNSALTSSEKS